MNAPLRTGEGVLRIADLSDPIACARIGAFVHGHPQGSPFHLPAWSRAVETGCGQKAHYLIAERGQNIVGVLPLTEMRSPLFGRAMVSAGFGVGGGILADDERAALLLADAAWGQARAHGCPTVELRGGAQPGPGWEADCETYLGFARDLAADDEAQLKAIPRKQRAEVRKALEGPLTVTIGGAARDVADHYAVYAESVRNLGTPVFPRRLFDRTRAEFGPAADLLVVRHGGAAVASVLSLYWKGTVFPYWGGGRRIARELRANDRMYFELMRHARERGCTRFDFGRSKAGTGPAAFKKNWGFPPDALTYFTRSAPGSAPRSVNPANPKYRLQVAAWKKLPLPIANAVGPWISRGLG